MFVPNFCPGFESGKEIRRSAENHRPAAHCFYEEARRAYEEALRIRHNLVQKNPETNLPHLAMTLNGLGNLDRA